ncbi:MAG TPA: creatininase family protein [Euryarchaeota archaeon]|nr:creatininase family protein [Euryarchaeota archaeon]
MDNKIFLCEMNMKEFEVVIESGSPIIIPVGAMEEHGSHLPLNTDTIQPEKIAAMVAEMVGGAIAPTVNYGNCSTTRNFPGTISIDTETLRMLMFEILCEFGRHGAKNIVVLSGHAGSSHMAALREAGKDFLNEYECKLMVLSDYDIAYKLKDELELPKNDGHGGMIETSRVLDIRPDLVGRGEDFVPTFPPFRVLKDPQVHFEGGIMGFPSRASIEFGQRLNLRIARELADMVSEMVEE